MRAFIEFMQKLIQSEWYGEIYIKVRGKEGITHFEKHDSVDVKPFKSGWNEAIPE